MGPEQIERNRTAQATLYGKPLGDLLRPVADVLGLTQARLAETLGLSAPMLSQLLNAQRVKIGNPQVVQRMTGLVELAERVAEYGADGTEIARRLQEIRGASEPVTTRTSQWHARGAEPRAVVRDIQDLLRAVAPADEILAAAALLEPRHPALATVLRLYGAGRTDDAVAHYRATVRAE